MSTKNLVLGVSGGIAAYKSCELLRLLAKAGHSVTVVPTEAALEFVGKTTWQALSGKPVHTSVFDESAGVGHVHLGQTSDLIVVAPATADLLARAASGRADDLLTTTLLAAHCPVVMCPAMHTEMWQHPATQANVATLRARGVIVMEPASGRLTGPDSGPGRLPDPSDIFGVLEGLLASTSTAAVQAQDLAGRHVVISAGGTREALDPVRYLGNASSGLMGIGLARAAALRGAEVTLVGANLEHPAPSNCRLVEVKSSAELATTMLELAPHADVVIMAAAVADFTPELVAGSKIKKDSRTATLDLHLVQTTDVLHELVTRRTAGQLIVGFAAETAEDAEHLLALGQAKLARKGCDLLVLNDVSAGKAFGHATNAITLLAPGQVLGQHEGAKNGLAQHILDAVVAMAPGHATEEN